MSSNVRRQTRGPRNRGASLRTRTGFVLAWIALFALVGTRELSANLVVQGPAQPPAQKTALLSLMVNDVPKGDAMIVIRPPDVLVPVQALQQAGVRGFAGRREMVGGQEHVSLASLSPDVAFTLDERDLVIRVTAAPRMLGQQEVRLRQAAPEGMEFNRAPSAFVNYGANWTRSVGADASAEAGVTVGPALAMTTVSWREQYRPVRGLTAVTIDNRDSLRRWTVGDTYVRASLLGYGGYLAGFRVAREYSVNPYFVSFPTGALSGEVLTPSTAEVYVNDRLVSRQVVEPGQFRLSDLPLTVGDNTTRIVLRDAFGRERQIETPFYVTTRALTKGLHDFDYAVGFPRRAFGQASFDYGQLSAAAQHRYGVTDSVTLGYRAEASGQLVSGGPTVNLRTPKGEVEIAAGASAGDGRQGTAAGVGYAFVGRPVSVGASLRAASRSYATLDSTPGWQPRLELNTSLGTQLFGRASVTVQHAYVDRWTMGTSSRLALVATGRVKARVTAIVSVAHTHEPHRDQVTFTMGGAISLAGRTFASVNLDHRDGRTRLVTEAQRALQIGEGWGYRLRLSGTDQAQGSFQYQGRAGRYEISQEQMGGQPGTRLSVAGGLVGIGGAVFATRPVDSSYALVRVPGAGGVRAFANNQPVGRTDRHGDILIPNLLPYYGNRLSIADQDVPLDYAVNEVERTVAPPYRGGALVTFHATTVQPAIGVVALVVGGQTVVPSFGEIRLLTPGGDQLSPLGRGGEFYFENVRAGVHAAVVQYRDVSCTFRLTMPASPDPFVRLGVQRCTVEEGRR